MMNYILGKLNDVEFDTNLYIQLQPKVDGFVKSYKNIVIQCGEEQITIPIEQLFNKLKELFKENKEWKIIV